MNEAWRKIQAASKTCLWLSWAATAWALLFYAALHVKVDLPFPVELALFWSLPFALVGGACAIFYVLVGARTARHVASGLLSAAANLACAWPILRM
jgi:hypothetical protein